MESPVAPATAKPSTKNHGVTNWFYSYNGHPSCVLKLLATFFGLGMLPLAPGTWGTMAAVPLAWGVAKLGQPAFIGFTLVVILVGVWVAELYGRATGKKDDQRIVIDEVAGYLVTVMLVERGVVQLILGFILFRLFDIWKPQPVRWMDQKLPGGWGVVLDDVGAGIYGAIILWIAERSGLIGLLAAKV